MHGADAGGLLLRLSVGGTLFAHGWNHAFRGGRIAGTGRWFTSIGFRHGRLQAVMATVTELGAGVLLVLGLLTPLAAAASIGTMLVAFLSNHRKNGFFIFRPGEGYEYVLMILVVSAALAAVGPGRVSLDWAFGITHAGGGPLALAAIVGIGSGLLVLATDWRAPVKE